MTYSWTQPICAECWTIQNPGREPVRLKAEVAEIEHCAFCAEPTTDGIYIRVDPTTVKWPTRLKE